MRATLRLFTSWLGHTGGKLRNQRGLTLVEVMISLGVLVVTSVGGVSAFILLNRWASNERNITAAKELCQERIEQAQTMTYSPVSNTPLVVGQTVNGTTGKNYKILGVAYKDANNPDGLGANYDNNGVLTSTGTLTTSSEPVNIYLRQENGTNLVAGTRTTTIALPTTLTDFTPGTGTGNQLSIVQFTVTVTYNYRGKDYSYSMYTLRSVD